MIHPTEHGYTYRGLVTLDTTGQLTFDPALPETDLAAWTEQIWKALEKFTLLSFPVRTQALALIQASDGEVADIPRALLREQSAVILECRSEQFEVLAFRSVALDFGEGWVSSIPVGYGHSAGQNARWIEQQKTEVNREISFFHEYAPLDRPLMLVDVPHHMAGMPMRGGPLPDADSFTFVTPRAYSSLLSQSQVSQPVRHPDGVLWTEVELPAGMTREARVLDPHYQGLVGIYSVLLDGSQAAGAWRNASGKAVPAGGQQLLMQFVVQEQADSGRLAGDLTIRSTVLGSVLRYLDQQRRPTGPVAVTTTRLYENVVPTRERIRTVRAWRMMVEDYSAWHLRLLQSDLWATEQTALSRKQQLVTLLDAPPLPTVHEDFKTTGKRLEKVTNGLRDRLKRGWKDLHGVSILEEAQRLSGFTPGGAASALAIYLWRVARQVYRIDETVLNALLKDTQKIDDLPTEQLQYLPQQAVYLPTPGLESSLGEALHGAFIAQSTSQGQPVIIVTLHTNQSHLESYVLPLGPKVNIRTSVESALLSWQSEDVRALGFKPDPQPAELVLSVLTAALYLCSVNTEATVHGSHTKNDPKSGLAQGNTLWDVGIRLGAALRKAASQTDESRQTTTGRGSSEVKPHLRRAHFHLFRHGPKTLPERPLRLRWLPPIPVKLDLNSEEDLPITVRAVEA